MNLRLLLIIISISICIVSNAKDFTLNSPDNKLELSVNVKKDITWSVRYNNQQVIDNVAIGLQLNDRFFGSSSKLKTIITELIDEKINPVISHKDSEVRNHCNELSLVFKDNFKLVFRAYDDGVAYRFIDKQSKPVTIINETMDIEFPEGTLSYFPEESSTYSHNECLYPPIKLSDLSPEQFCSLPVLFKTENDISVLFTEASLFDYPGMFLQTGNGSSLQTKFPKYVLEAVSVDDRNQKITKEADYIAKNEGKKQYPWRVFVIADNDAKLIESNLLMQLSDDCVLENTSWIKPGRVAWDWYNANNIFGVDFESGINNETYKYYIDFASENGIEYVILDEGWTKSTTEILACHPDIDVAELVKYGEARNVGIILWVLWKPLAENTAEILETYKKWGAKGIKVDFMQRSDQGMVSSYESIAKECARLQMLVDYHGAFKPSGIEKKYPNLINYEGVKGSENNKWSQLITPEHNVTIPFTRMMAGPMDYTPGCMLNASLENHLVSFTRPMSLGTRCHQVAMYVVYEAPLQMLCENPSIYKQEQETVDFIKQIPTTWDETRVLYGAVSDYVVVARRKGDDWYIGGMTDWTKRSFEIAFDFLAEGEYQAEIMQDGVNADKFAQDYKKEAVIVNAQTKLGITLASGGGWAAIIRRK